MTTRKGLFSLVVPVFNEEEVLEDTFQRLGAILAALNRPYEVLVVDNGSTDRTPAIAAELCRRDGRWRYLRLSRNFGYQNSITAGMLASQGDAVMVIDADLQDPPELIPEFIRRWEEGNDIVYGIREKRVGESVLRVWPTMMAMRLIPFLSDEPKMPAHSGDFRLISRRVRDALMWMPERNRYMRGIVHWLGFRQIGVPYTRQGRTKGVSKVNWVFLIGFTFNAIVNTSAKLLRVFALLGLGVLGLTAALAVAWACQTLDSVSGLHLLTLLNLGVLSLGTGILGEYVAKIHLESKRRPLWVVDYTINLDPAHVIHPWDAAGTAPPPSMLGSTAGGPRNEAA